MTEDEPGPATVSRRPARRRRGRPNPWLYLAMAVVWTALAGASWLLGDDLVLSIGWTVLAVGNLWLSWSAYRHRYDPLPVGHGRWATSRWAGGRPDERWQ